ncbi:XRE family transcriptional regulator [bacterium]|nr:MAG: XRE family transcriptional regulator [bacterium]
MSLTLEQVVQRSLLSVSLTAALVVPPALPRCTRTTAMDIVAGRLSYKVPDIYLEAQSTGAFTETVVAPNLMKQLADILPGVSRERLARIMGVSRQSVQGWLRGETIAGENEQRLQTVLTLLFQVRARHEDLATFVQRPTAVGSPIDLLGCGRDDVVMAIAYGTIPPLPTPTVSRIKPVSFIQARPFDRIRDAAEAMGTFVRDSDDTTTVEDDWIAVGPGFKFG